MSEENSMSEENRVTVAVLDSNGHLVGVSRGVDGDSLREGEVVVEDGIDLPLNGTYKYDHDRKTFIPLGHGFPRVSTRPPYSETMVLAMVVRSLGDKAPPEVREWADWYDAHLKKRDEEFVLSAVRRGKLVKG